MRYVGVVALAVLFWSSVVTVRMLIELPPAPRPRPLMTFPPPAARVEPALPPLIEPLPDPRDPTTLELMPRAPSAPWSPLSVLGRNTTSFDAAMADLRFLIDSCRPFDDPPAVFQVEAVVLADGRVWSAAAKGKRAGSAAARCVEDGFMSLRFPPADADVTLHHRLRLYRHSVRLL